MSLGGHRFIARRDRCTGFDVPDVRVPSVAQKGDNRAGLAPLLPLGFTVHLEK
jgi:hypothetical protein